jgi:hypothetical protein
LQTTSTHETSLLASGLIFALGYGVDWGRTAARTTCQPGSPFFPIRPLEHLDMQHLIGDESLQARVLVTQASQLLQLV